MTKVYFVRHARPDFSVQDDFTRPLTKDGQNSSKKVSEFLSKKNISTVYSSPYKRAVDTLSDFAESLDFEINIIDDFRERKIDDVWVEDFDSFAKKQWDDFHYKLPAGESINEVQIRNIKALNKLLEENKGGNIAVGTHGTALSCIINYYNKDFKLSEFNRIRDLMPFIVCLTFKEKDFVEMKEFKLT